MNVLVVGAGPAGLLFAIQMRQMFPRTNVCVIERNPEGATYGFGVAIQDRASAKLLTYNKPLFQKVLMHMHRFKGQDITLGDQLVKIDRADISGAGAIERIALLKILRDRAKVAGANIQYETEFAADQDLQGYDLVVAADGANSVVRDQFAKEFGTCKSTLGNRFAWYGTNANFDAPGLVFRKVGDWVLAAHFYQHSAEASSFVGECDALSWERYGFGDLTDVERREVFEEVFAPELQGENLIENRSIWRAWSTCTNDHWWYKKFVLIGDARHATHPTIGSGTRLAFDDAQALVEALNNDCKPLSARLQDYEATRRKTAEKLISAMVLSYEWYESMREHMNQHPLDFVHSYMTRTGRIDNQMLGFALPEFMGRYLAHVQEKA